MPRADLPDLALFAALTKADRDWLSDQCRRMDMAPLAWLPQPYLSDLVMRWSFEDHVDLMMRVKLQRSGLPIPEGLRST